MIINGKSHSLEDIFDLVANDEFEEEFSHHSTYNNYDTMLMIMSHLGVSKGNILLIDGSQAFLVHPNYEYGIQVDIRGAGDFDVSIVTFMSIDADQVDLLKLSIT